MNELESPDIDSTVSRPPSRHDIKSAGMHVFVPIPRGPWECQSVSESGTRRGVDPRHKHPVFPRTIYGHKSRDPVSRPEHDLRSTTTPRLCWRGLSSITPLRSSLLPTRTPRRPRIHFHLPRSALSPTRRSHVQLCTRQRPTGSFHHSVNISARDDTALGARPRCTP